MKKALGFDNLRECYFQAVSNYALKKHIINGDGEQRMWMVINPHPLQSYHKFLFIEPSFYLDKTAMFQQFIKVRNNTELYEY